MYSILCVVALALAGTDDRTDAKAQNPSISSEDDLGDAQEIWPIRIREAIRLGLEHRPTLHVTFAGDRNDFVIPNCFGPTTEVEDKEKRPRPAFANRTSIVVEPANADAGNPRIKSEVSATIRTVQKQYGQLATAHVALWAADKAVNRARELIEIEQAIGDLFCGEDLEDYAASLRYLERFENALAARNADVKTAEARIRTILGESEFDKRRIIPVTPPIDAPIDFTWESCLDDVLAKRLNPPLLKDFCPLPRLNVIEALKAFDETLLQRAIRLDVERRFVLWQLDLPCISPSDGSWTCGSPSQTLPWYVLRRRPRQPPPSAFTRTVLKAQSTYQEYATARRSRIATDERMAAQRLDWGKRRIAADRYLDTIQQFALAVANERRRLAEYESAVFAVNECEGILLDEHNIIVVGPHRRDER
jgi:hypothetical protein